METGTKNKSINYIRASYVLFICLSLYHLLYHKDYIEASMNMGIALIFDPFDQNITWNSRPKWQRIWIIVHLALASALLGFGISQD